MCVRARSSGITSATPVMVCKQRAEAYTYARKTAARQHDMIYKRGGESEERLNEKKQKGSVLYIVQQRKVRRMKTHTMWYSSTRYMVPGLYIIRNQVLVQIELTRCAVSYVRTHDENTRALRHKSGYVICRHRNHMPGIYIIHTLGSLIHILPTC